MLNKLIFLISIISFALAFEDVKPLPTSEEGICETNYEGISPQAKIGVLTVNHKINPFSYPGYDTLYWHDYSPYNGGYTILGFLAGFGVKLTPEYYPAIITGVHHRVFRLNWDSIQIRIVDDDGANGAPQTMLYKRDTLTQTYSTNFIYHPLPPPKCTIWDGSFYLFMLDNHHPRSQYDYGLNWLRDNNGVQAPTGYHWRRDSLGNYTQFSPAGDMEMGAVVEYHDIGLDSLRGLPEVVFYDSTYSINAFVHELGGFSETDAPVVLKIGGAFLDTEYVSLNPNGTNAVVFNWTVNLPEGNYTCTCYTALRSDTRKSNDTILVNFSVICYHDVGCTKIEAPTGRIDSGTVVTPACSVYNYGNQTVSYSVRMKIGTDYNQTASVSDHTPGTYLYLTFPDWTAGPVGTHPVTCTTELTNDMDNENDKETSGVEVIPPEKISEETKERIRIKVLSNPIRNTPIISYNGPERVASLRIYNAYGELVYSSKSEKGFFTLKKLPAGIYLLRLSAKGDKKDRKIVIMR